MSFDLPSAELQAPSRPVRDLAEVASDVAVVATYGSAKGISRLPGFSHLRSLWISGLSEKVVPIVGRLQRLETLVVHDYRAPSFSGLASLGNLHSLAVAGSRLRSLEGLERLAQLRQLLLVLVTGIDRLDPLAALTGLETLCIEGDFSTVLRLQTLQPLSTLRGLRRLRLASLAVANRSLEPLHSLTQLREVFIADAFPPEEFRRLGAAVPRAAGEWLDSFKP